MSEILVKIPDKYCYYSFGTADKMCPFFYNLDVRARCSLFEHKNGQLKVLSVEKCGDINKYKRRRECIMLEKQTKARIR